MKKVLSGGKETRPDILRGGNRNPIGKCNEKWWDSFFHISLGLNTRELWFIRSIWYKSTSLDLFSLEQVHCSAGKILSRRQVNRISV